MPTPPIVAHAHLDPALTLIAGALKLQLAASADAAGQRAVDRAVEHLASNPVYEFDGVELRIASFSRGAGVEHITDGEICTCEGRKHAWCLHRAEFRLLLARLALESPLLLRAKIVEQMAPADDWMPADSIFDYAA